MLFLQIFISWKTLDQPRLSGVYNPVLHSVHSVEASAMFTSSGHTYTHTYIFSIHDKFNVLIPCCNLSKQTFMFILDGRIERLQDFLAKLYDVPSEKSAFNTANIKTVMDSVDLSIRYQNIMLTVKKSGNLEAARKTK